LHGRPPVPYKSATIAEIRDLAIQQGMTTLTQDGIEKILKGQTDIAQLRAVTAGG